MTSGMVFSNVHRRAMKRYSRNPYDGKTEPRKRKAWNQGYADFMLGKHDPLGRGYKEIGEAAAYTQGYRACQYV